MTEEAIKGNTLPISPTLQILQNTFTKLVLNPDHDYLV